MHIRTCSSASCGLAFTSSVTAGNTLAFALGWYGQSPPSTPTDTRGDTFTLGVSNSVSAPSGNPPTLVQKNYNSNSTSASYGLAFTSTVVSGNTLAFALGSVNQSPPSTPTDTRGNTFTLGVSNSVAGPAPTLVQKNYNSNCSSASCGLAFTSSVSAGNTLAFALGWYGQSPPSTPTDTRGNTFALGASNSVQVGSGGTLALDGSNTNQAAGSGSIATTLTTTNANDVIIAYVSPANTGATTPPSVSGISGGGLTWLHRVTTPTYAYV